jgi:thiamine biosynthesis lipoprotein
VRSILKHKKTPKRTIHAIKGYTVRVNRIGNLSRQVGCGVSTAGRGAGKKVENAAGTLFVVQHPAMGTIFSLYLYADSIVEAEALAAPAFAEIDRIETLHSHYRPGSELSRINREAACGPVKTDEETFNLLSRALHWSAVSDGAFDVTVGKLMKAWGFFSGNGSLPSPADCAAVRSQVGWERVQLDEGERTVRFLSAGVELDPGGIGKGFAVECAIAALRSANVKAALLSAGGSTIFAMGAPIGRKGWQILVPAGGREEATLSTITVRDTALSTANASEKHFVHNGRLYSHIMDPRTLQPVERTLQVSVIAPSATDSDALSNALFVMETQERARLLHELPGVSALVISGTPKWAVCRTIRWSAPVRRGFCATVVNEKGQ